MRALSNVDLLDVWEAGLSQTTVERALALVAAAEPEVPVEELARLSVGRRDLLLFLLRRQLFGEALPLTAACPACGEQAEATVDVNELLLDETSAQEALVEADGYAVRFRLPNSIDLAAVAGERSNDDAAMRLLAACIVDAQRHGESIDAPSLPDDVIVKVAERMAELDPQADIELALNCPSCRHEWVAPLDIVSFFWDEIHAWAQRTMQDVHVIASSYGWSEREILRMSVRRRRTYLELIGA